MADVFAPPDPILQSVIGRSDGEVCDSNCHLSLSNLLTSLSLCRCTRTSIKLWLHRQMPSLALTGGVNLLRSLFLVAGIPKYILKKLNYNKHIRYIYVRVSMYDV